MAPYTISVGSDHPVSVPVGSGGTTLTVIAGGTLYYADTYQVSASNNQGSIALNGSATVSSDTPLWVISASESDVSVNVTSQAAPSGASVPSNVVTKTANYTAAANDKVEANASGGAFTVTLPLSPAVGALVTVIKTDSSGNAVAVVAQGGSIQGDVGGASITAQWSGGIFQHDGSNVWTAISPISDYVGAMALAPTAVKTGTYTANVGDFVPCDSSTGGFTITLPNAPTDQARIGVTLVNGSNTVTVAAAGTDVFDKVSGPTTKTLTASGQVLLLQYYAAPKIWYVHVPAVSSGTSSPIGTATLITATNASWPIPAGATMLEIVACGGGGGGGGGGSAASTQLQAGGGAGAAGTVAQQIVSVGANTTLNVNIGGGGGGGAGGAAASSPGGGGTTGSDTTVTATGISVTGKGGTRGAASLASSTTPAGGGIYGNASNVQNSSTSVPVRAGDGGFGGSSSGHPSGYAASGGGGGGAATTTNGGNGGNAGGAAVATAGASGGSGTSAGGNGASAAANSGGGGGGGGGGAAGTGAGGNGGVGGSGWVIVKVVG